MLGRRLSDREYACAWVDLVVAVCSLLPGAQSDSEPTTSSEAGSRPGQGQVHRAYFCITL
jgi:hypothetical protein